MISEANEITGLVEVAVRKVARLSEDQDLRNMSVFDVGIDSLTVVDLIMELESLTGARIPLEDLSEEVFSSLDALAAFVQRYVP